jgi:hypothetical protein
MADLGDTQMQTASIKRAAGLSAVGSLLLLNTACAIVDPYMSAKDLSAESGYQQVRKDALNIADKMEENTSQLEYLDLATGLTILAAGIAGTSFAAFDFHRDSIVIAGIVGGSAAGLRAFVPTQARKEIYLRGSAAIQCAVTATEFGEADKVDDQTPNPGVAMAAAPRTESNLSSRLNNLSELTKEWLRGDEPRMMAAAPAISRAAADPLTAPAATLIRMQELRLRAAVGTMSEKIDETKDAFSELERNRAAVLETAVRAAVIAVNAQLVEKRLDPDKALSAAKAEIDKATAPAEGAAESLKKSEEGATDNKKELSALADLGTLSATSLQGAAEAKPEALNSLRTASTNARSNAESVNPITQDASKVAEEMLRLIDNSKACFVGLV